MDTENPSAGQVRPYRAGRGHKQGMGMVGWMAVTLGCWDTFSVVSINSLRFSYSWHGTMAALWISTLGGTSA